MPVQSAICPYCGNNITAKSLCQHVKAVTFSEDGQIESLELGLQLPPAYPIYIPVQQPPNYWQPYSPPTWPKQWPVIIWSSGSGYAPTGQYFPLQSSSTDIQLKTLTGPYWYLNRELADDRIVTNLPPGIE